MHSDEVSGYRGMDDMAPTWEGSDPLWEGSTTLSDYLQDISSDSDMEIEESGAAFGDEHSAADTVVYNVGGLHGQMDEKFDFPAPLMGFHVGYGATVVRVAYPHGIPDDVKVGEEMLVLDVTGWTLGSASAIYRVFRK